MGLDLLNKTVGSSLGLMFFTIFNFYIAYSIRPCPSYLWALLTLSCLSFVGRFISLQFAKRKTSHPKKEIAFIRLTIVPNMALSLASVGFLIYHSQFESFVCLVPLVEVALVTVSCTYTLSSSLRMSSSVQTLAFISVLIPGLVCWSRSHHGYILTITATYAVLYLYLLMSAKKAHFETLTRHKHDLSLEKVIKELKLSKALLIEETTKAEHAARLSTLGEMAGGIAHEINNPLTIIGFLNGKLERKLLSGKYESKELLELSVKIDETTTRISRIVRGLRSLSRNGESDPFERIKIKDLCGQILDVSSGRFYNANINFTLAHQDAEVELECRPVQISQVIMNLLNNAVDAIQGNQNPWIKIHTSVTADNVNIRISDSGHGIPAQIAEKIFQPFFTTKENGKGTGLGLSISAGLIKRHHGKIYIDQNASNTTFVIELPIKQSRHDSVANADGADQAA